ncbi:MAG: CPBP family intramembrane metalloprotease [Leptospiraceae bacterium]|nr:CPBP family intramembrane metalloprotease [Leptospiraceae bacterium]
MEKYNRTFTFYGLSVIIPWIMWFIVAYLSYLPEQSASVLMAQQILGMGGLVSPLIVALVLIFKDKELIDDFKSRFFNVQQYNHFYTFLAIFLIFLAMVCGQLISVFFGHSLDQFYISGKPSFTSFLFSPWIILVSAPVLEEFAWHCYGTDTLRRKFSLFVTSMIFAVYWVLWHLPLSFVKGYYHSNVMAEGPLYSLNFVFSLFVFVILMNWLYYKTKRNILITILFHLSANISNEIFATHPDSKVIQTVLLLIISVYVLIKDRGMFFNKEVLD